jgi:hypothetical protein
MPNSKFVWIAAALLALSFCLRVAASDDNILKKKISLQAQTARPTNYIVQLLREGGIPAGVEDFGVGCEEDSELQMPTVEGTLGDGLILTRQRVGALGWQLLGGSLLVVKGAPVPSVLDAQVEQFTFNSSDPPSKITNALLTIPAVAKSIAKLGVSMGSPELGFAQAKNESDERVVLKNVTVREALNSIAKSAHPRVWLYRQRPCGGRQMVTINWVVK